MAHYAKVVDDIVCNVIAVSNEVVGAYPESEAIGRAFIASLGLEGDWIETFIGVEGKTYAGIGYTWNGTDFVAPPAPPPAPID